MTCAAERRPKQNRRGGGAFPAACKVQVTNRASDEPSHIASATFAETRLRVHPPRRASLQSGGVLLLAARGGSPLAVAAHRPLPPG